MGHSTSTMTISNEITSTMVTEVTRTIMLAPTRLPLPIAGPLPVQGQILEAVSDVEHHLRKPSDKL